MKFSLEATDANQILSYDNQHVIVGPEKKTYPLQLGESLIVTPNQVITDIQISDITCLSEQDINKLYVLEPEIIIFVLDSAISRPPLNTLLEFSKQSIGVEYMALGSACRTYNLLVLEDRRAVLVLALSDRNAGI